jgi:hypothetical protein
MQTAKVAKLRKNLYQVLEESEIEINPDHVNDWHYCNSGAPFFALQKLFKDLSSGTFNFAAAISSPRSIRYRQRDSDFDGGKRGDYQFVDQNGGKMAIPSKIFKLLFP